MDKFLALSLSANVTLSFGDVKLDGESRNFSIHEYSQNEYIFIRKYCIIFRNSRNCRHEVNNT